MTRVGYTTGVFDMFHVGHLRLLEQASRACDELVVGVTTDELSLEVKGKTPIVPFEERLEIVHAIGCVGRVIPQTSMDKFEAWKVIKFDRMFVGDDWRGTEKWNKLEKLFGAVGVEIQYFPYTHHTSSSLLREVLESVRHESAPA